MTQDLKPPPIGSDIEIYEDVLSEAFKANETDMQEQEQAQEFLPPLIPDLTRVKGRLLKEPPPLESVLNYYNESLIVRGIVGTIVAEGGTGKTYLMCQLAYAMTEGGNLGPLKAPKPLKVLLLTGEDPQAELDRRLWAIGKGVFPDNLYAVSVTGKVGPLMKLLDGNPIRSKWYFWLEETIKNHDLDVLMFDPKSRFYGLDENSNEHNTQWVTGLEALAVKYNLTILFSHHTNKASSGNDKLESNMSRGGSALIDSCRFAIGLRRMPESTANKLDIKDYRLYIEFDVTKTNLAPKLPESLYFKQGEEGVFSHAELNKDRLEKMAKHLCELLKQDKKEYISRNLIKDSIGKNIVDQMEGNFNKFTRSKDMPPIIDYALKRGWLIEETEKGKPGQPRKILKVK